MARLARAATSAKVENMAAQTPRICGRVPGIVSSRARARVLLERRSRSVAVKRGASCPTRSHDDRNNATGHARSSACAPGGVRPRALWARGPQRARRAFAKLRPVHIRGLVRPRPAPSGPDQPRLAPTSPDRPRLSRRGCARASIARI